jgi:TRAP transporter 4TM/12TM fusion protein
LRDDETLAGVIRENGFLATAVTVLAVALALFHLVTSYSGQLEAFRHRTVHLMMVLIVLFLASMEQRYSKEQPSAKRAVCLLVDAAFAILSAVVLIYTFANSTEIPLRAGSPTTTDLFMGTVLLFLVIEASRRHVGMSIVVVTVFFLIYVYAGPWFPGFLNHAPFSVGEIINIQYLDLEGVWGSPVAAAAGFVIVFLIFAGLLMETGVLDVFMNFTMKLVGKSTGGPAKVAVISSGLVGMVNGTAVGNALLVGQVSIPLMKKLGYRPQFAAAVEATSSTGGQVMPPIMGSAAFIIAMVLGISYGAVCKAAVVPAVLWFFSIYCIVHLEARKHGLMRLSDEDMKALPSWRSLASKSYLILPLFVLIYLMLAGASEVKAGFWGVVSLLAASMLGRDTRFTLRTLVKGLNNAVRMTFSVTTACACAGIIVGCVMQSGLGYTLSTSLINVAGGRMSILLPLVMITALILGTGMMTVGVYIIVSVLLVPAMTAMGLHVLACHLFAFYFGILCNITPPVATATYGAAGLAGSNPWDTGVEAFKMAIPILAVPYIFIFQPGLLLEGSPVEILGTIAFAFVAVFSLDVFVTGYLFRRVTIPERLLFFVASMLCCHPALHTSLVGAGIFAVLWVVQRMSRATLPEEQKGGA